MPAGSKQGGGCLWSDGPDIVIRKSGARASPKNFEGQPQHSIKLPAFELGRDDDLLVGNTDGP